MSAPATWLIASALSAGPVLLVALGEQVGQRTGVHNLGLQGLVATGAAVALAVQATTHSPLLAALAGAAAAAAVALVHAVSVALLRVEQVVRGVVVLLLGLGIAGWLGEAAPEIPSPAAWPIGLALALVALWVALLRGTRLGLTIEVAGALPRVLDSVGGSVALVRGGATLLGGLLAGLGGAAAAGSAAGLGWLALVLVPLCRWSPAGLVLGAWVAGAIRCAPTLLSLSPSAIQAMQLLLPAAALAALAWRSPAPAALGQIYARERDPADQ